MTNATRLPTWDEIFTVSRYLNPYSTALKMMQVIEDAGQGESCEREMLNLIINYDRTEADIKCRLYDMMFGNRLLMQSYNGYPKIKG